MRAKSKAQKTRPRRRDPTRARLINAALEAFAKHGVGAVSLRSITAASGAANQSAVHYHFNNKRGLIRAILDDINERLAPLQAEALEELKGIAQKRTPTVREIVAIGFAPFVYLFQESRDGRMALRFFSRLTWESGQEGQGLLVKAVQPYFLQLEPHLQAALPEKPRDALAFHTYLAVNNLIHGLVDITLLGQDPVLGVDDLYRRKPEHLLNYFYDYVSAGLGSAVDSSR